MARKGGGRPKSGPLSRHVEAFLEMLAAERGAARLTIEAYRNDLGDFAGFLAAAGKPVEAADVAALRRYLARPSGAGMASPPTAPRLPSLRQFHKFLSAQGRRPAR